MLLLVINITCLRRLADLQGGYVCRFPRFSQTELGSLRQNGEVELDGVIASL